MKKSPSTGKSNVEGKGNKRTIDTTLLDSLVGYNLRRAAARQRERFHSVFDQFDIRPVQLTALTLIYLNPRRSQTGLGRTLEMKRANVVKLLDELQDRNLLERRPSAHDRRAYEIHLTRKGLDFTRKLLEVHEKLEADLARSFGRDELQRLVEQLRKFRQIDADPNLG